MVRRNVCYGMSNARNGAEDNEELDSASRRQLLAAVGVAAAGATGYFAGSASAATPAGTVGTSTNPYLRAYVDTIAFVDTSDPSSPDDGTLWYNSSA